MHISHFNDPFFGIKGVTNEEIDKLNKLCDKHGQIPFSGADIKHYYYAYEFSEEEWKCHIDMCEALVKEVLVRVKYLPDKIDHFDWWELDEE